MQPAMRIVSHFPALRIAERRFGGSGTKGQPLSGVEVSRRFCAGKPALIPFRFCLLLLSVSLVPQVAQCQKQPLSPSLAAGRTVFLQRCAVCHSTKGQGSKAIGAPNLQAFNDPKFVMHTVETGKSIMPNFSKILSRKQIQNVAAYVTQKIAVDPIPQGNLSYGGELFRQNCAACHRSAVRGGALAFTGINAPSLVGKSPALIAAMVRTGPGPMPRFPVSDISNQQLASIIAYVQYVQHPPSPGGAPLGWYGPVAEGFVAWIILFAVIGLTFWIERGGKG